MKIEFETKVRGGLTITVEADVAPAEPDVGLFGPYVEDWSITQIAGRPREARWLERILTEDERQRIVNLAVDAYMNRE